MVILVVAGARSLLRPGIDDRQTLPGDPIAVASLLCFVSVHTALLLSPFTQVPTKTAVVKGKTAKKKAESESSDDDSSSEEESSDEEEVSISDASMRPHSAQKYTAAALS